MEGPFLVDGSELLEDAVVHFATALDRGDFVAAGRFVELAFYLAEHRVEAPR